ncbi:ABC transporter substrate-binding protein [Segeticoccus rhizosphaerae]|uniref:ABC transporter substrate-binding protein n=1 Tax=Segeticoccus rhizosphaerae TaxID=1104777 RepID=UPI0013900140|nr:ABC transporter substrate-binding protein [Ornithinicoccus soli]
MALRVLKLPMMLSLSLCLVAAGCGSSDTSSGSSQSGAAASENQAGDSQEQTITVGLQINIISQAFRVLADHDNLVKIDGRDVNVKWVQTTSGPALNSALVSGNLDAGFMAGPPFLIAFNKNVPVRVASDAGVVPILCLSRDPKVKSPADIPRDAKIAVPAPGSFQDLTLQKVSKDTGADLDQIKKQEVAMPQDVAFGDITGKSPSIGVFCGAPPYTSRALKTQGMHVIASASQAYGKKYPFQMLVARNEFYSKQPKEYAALVTALRKALSIMASDPKRVATLLVKDNPKLELEQTTSDLQDPDTHFSDVPGGLMEVANFMESQGIISKVPNLSDILFPNLQDTGAN